MNNYSTILGKKDRVRLTEEFLRRAVDEQRGQGPGHSESELLRQEFSEVQRLHLGVKGIVTIERLWEFTSLTALHLNNNLIQRLTGLSRLTNLITLDVSFNKIVKIEGLESLKKLEELNLSHNKISVLENMDSLENLASCNIASNNLKDLNQVMYLRRLKKLSILNFSKNPLSEGGDYKLFVIAFIHNLKYLDFKCVTSDTREEAVHRFHLELKQIKDEELEREKEKEASRALQAEQQLHMDAFVESLNGPFLFDQMIKNDPQADKLLCVLEIKAEQNLFKEKMTELCVQLFETGLVELQRRQAELNTFSVSHNITKSEIKRKKLLLLDEFDDYFKEFKRESASTSQTLNSSPMDVLQKLHHQLLSLEFRLNRQIEKMIEKLHEETTKLIASLNNSAQEIFVQSQDLEEKYHQKIEEIIAVIIENVSKDEDVELLPEDFKTMLDDKKTLMTDLRTAHENHLLVIRDRESLLNNRANAWKSSLIKKLKEEELLRNRTVLSDYTIFVSHYEEEIQRLLNR